jgi:hypothetical protein
MAVRCSGHEGPLRVGHRSSLAIVRKSATGALPPLIARSANVQNSVESLPIDDNSFDKALAINSMQY